MWKKSRESVNTAKILAEKLGKFWRNKEFIVDVLNAIDGNNDICSQIIDYLDKNSFSVPSEIFAKLSELGCTVNYKNSEIAELRRKCFRGSDRENYNKLFESLRNTQVLLINEWNLNEEDNTKFENANIGDTVNIETDVLEIDSKALCVATRHVVSMSDYYTEDMKDEAILETIIFALYLNGVCWSPYTGILKDDKEEEGTRGSGDLEDGKIIYIKAGQ